MNVLHRNAVEQDLREAMASGDWEAVERIMPVLDRLPPNPAPSLVGAALWYAEQGFRVFPCSPGSKVPRKGSAGCKDATSDTEQVRAWWKADPYSNVAIATGYLVDVVDFDGLVGHEAWAAYWAAHPDQDDGSLAPGSALLATVSTPRPGGLHAYVRAAGEGNGQRLMAGVDYRGLGGYVLAPPSRTDQGTYQFLRPLQPGLSPW